MSKTIEDRHEFITVRHRTDSRIRKIKENYWETFTKNMEHGLPDAQCKVWRMLRNWISEINGAQPMDTINLQH